MLHRAGAWAAGRIGGSPRTSEWALSEPLRVHAAQAPGVEVSLAVDAAMHLAPAGGLIVPYTSGFADWEE